MREIKFRAWEKKRKRMLWRTIFDREWYDYKDLSVGIALPEDRNRVELMQYTGLKDKNGTEIYEGDIVLTKVNAGGIHDEPDDWVEESGEVYFEDGYFTVKGKLMSGTLAARNENSEVIGNIYENKELLK